MIYLSFMPQTYASKNQLETKVKDLLRANDRKMIYVEELDDFKSMLIAGIERINKAYPRCAPVKIKFQTSIGRGQSEAVDYFISWNDTVGSNGHKLCQFEILASR